MYDLANEIFNMSAAIGQPDHFLQEYSQYPYHYTYNTHPLAVQLL